MAELDYAFLAEYAKVEQGGNLTAVGASFTYVTVPTFPAQYLLSVAGRVRADVSETPQLRIQLRSPDESISIGATAELHAGPEARPYGPQNDTVGIQFAFTVTLPLPTAGLYDVRIHLDDSEVRHLAFSAEQALASA